MRWQWIVVAVVLMCVGCSKQQYGQCSGDKDHLKVVFKPKNKAHPFSHSFCVVCNPKLQPSEYGAWALEMGAPDAPDSVEGKHPCLYVYSGNQTNIDTMAQCQAMVCNGGAAYSDLVGKGNGNLSLGSVVNGELENPEQWILDENVASEYSTPHESMPHTPADPTLQY